MIWYSFKNIYSFSEDFWYWRRHFYIFQEFSKIKRQRNIIFKKQNQKYYEILTIYECVEKIIDDFSACNIWMIFLVLNWLFYDPSWILQLSEFVWTLRSLAWVAFNTFLLIDATDRSKINSDQKRLYFAVSLHPLLFFANTPFKNRCQNWEYMVIKHQ